MRAAISSMPFGLVRTSSCPATTSTGTAIVGRSPDRLKSYSARVAALSGAIGIAERHLTKRDSAAAFACRQPGEKMLSAAIFAATSGPALSIAAIRASILSRSDGSDLHEVE